MTTQLESMEKGIWYYSTLLIFCEEAIENSTLNFTVDKLFFSGTLNTDSWERNAAHTTLYVPQIIAAVGKGSMQASTKSWRTSSRITVAV